MSRMYAIAWKELIQLRRDRMTLGMMIMLPVMQLLLFGYAIDTDVRNIATVVYDQDHSATSRLLIEQLRATGFYNVVGAVDHYDDILHAFRTDKARVAVVIPAGLHAAILKGQSAQAQLVVDGSDPQTVASASNTAAGLVSAQSLATLTAKLRAAGISASEPLRLEPTTWLNPELRTAVYIVPGLTGVIITMTMVMLTAMAIAREHERGTMEALIVSPIGRVELVLGKILPYVVIGYVQVTLILLVGRAVFDVPLVGSVWLLYALSFLFIAANLALGLLFSTIARTQQQAMQMSFFFILPNMLLSGFMFPWEGMPKAAQWLSQALPLTHFLRIVRGIALKGSSFDDLRPEVIWLAALLFVLVALSTARFRKKLV